MADWNTTHAPVGHNVRDLNPGPAPTKFAGRPGPAPAYLGPGRVLAGQNKLWPGKKHVQVLRLLMLLARKT